MSALDRLRGYAIVWNALSVPIAEDGREIVETVEYGAASWLRSCVSNYGHAEHLNFASIEEGTLSLWNDAKGVAFQADIPATVRGAGIRNAMRDRSQVWGISPHLTFFGRSVAREGDTLIARVTRCRIEHISLTNSPAYPATCAWLESQPEQSMPSILAATAFGWGIAARRALAIGSGAT